MWKNIAVEYLVLFRKSDYEAIEGIIEIWYSLLHIP